MASSTEKTHAARSFVWLVILLIWLELWQRITEEMWRVGVTKVGWMVVVLACFFGAIRWRRFLPPIGSSATWRAFVFAGLCVSVTWVSFQATTELRRPDHQSAGLDIALNTIAAEDWLLQGKNPYRERAQIQHEMHPGPNITVNGGEVRLMGVPYSYGYPYFPMMFLSYMPFRLVAPQVNGIRVGNLVFLLLNTALILVLSRRLIPGRAGWTVGGLAAIAALSGGEMLRDLFEQGSTDLVIVTYALAAYWCMSRRQLGLAGVLFGLAQSCKLLPGPLLIAPALIWMFRRPGFRSLLVGYVVACAVCLGPFLVASPAHFISSTVLFYRAHHWAGDNSALWFFLPDALKEPVSLLGYVSTAAVVLFAWRRREGSLLWPMALSFASYMVFMAFARMIHVNYFWSIYALGCVTFFAFLASGPEADRAT